MSCRYGDIRKSWKEDMYMKSKRSSFIVLEVCHLCMYTYTGVKYELYIDANVCGVHTCINYAFSERRMQLLM